MQELCLDISFSDFRMRWNILSVAMVISSLVGTIIPILFHKIHIDPAVASGPLITTINDLVAVITYYGLSLIFLIEIFHI